MLLKVTLELKAISSEIVLIFIGSDDSYSVNSLILFSVRNELISAITVTPFLFSFLALSTRDLASLKVPLASMRYTLSSDAELEIANL